MARDAASSDAPLDGITVLDLTRLLPGAFATLALADLGATVVKVEDRRGGDPLRLVPPFVAGGGAYHLVLNRNKRSLSLDLRHPQARDVLDALVAGADVLVESFRPSTARQAGVSAPDLLARHPHLVHCSISGYGQDGPRAEGAGHDINYVATAGLLPIASGSGGVAGPPPFLLADTSAGLYAVSGILAALLRRARTGRGAAVDVSLQEAALSWLNIHAAPWLAGASAPMMTLPVTGRFACYGVYAASDRRQLALGALEPKFWARICDRVGRPQWTSRQYDPGSQDELRTELEHLFASRPAADWLRTLGDEDTCVSLVATVDEVAADAHLRARGALTVGVGGVQGVRAPIRVAPEGSTFQPLPLTAAPTLGADTDEWLRRAGFDEARIASLRASGVV